MGELLAAQFLAAMGQVTGCADGVGNLAVGSWRQQRVFQPGARLPWPELIRTATGADLQVEAFARRCATL